MCRLIGFVSPTATTLAELVGGAQCSTFQHMSRLHADGWGTAWLDEAGEVDSVTTAAPGQDDPELAQAMADEAVRARIVHLRMATDGMAVRAENSHPFVTDGIALAHNGSVVPTGLLRDNLTDDVLAGVRGDTDSELYLAAIRQGVRAGLSLSDAVFETVTWLRAAYPVASLNALILSPTQFIAVHASATAPPPHEDFAASGFSADELPLDHLNAYYQLSYLRAADGAVAFSSTGIDRAGWTALPAESITTVDLSSYELSTRTLVSPAEQPPAAAAQVAP